MLRRLGRPLGTAALLCVLATACTGESDDSPEPEANDGTPTAEPIDLEGQWRLTSGTVEGEELPLDPEHPITLQVQGEQVTGEFACNDFDLTVADDEGEISFGPGSSTARTCPPALEDLDMVFLDALVVVHTGERTEDALTLEGTDVTLEFEAAEPS